MNKEDAIKDALLEILQIGFLRIRAFGNASLAEACSVEADHLHNLPMLIREFRWELLLYYCNVERSEFVKQATHNVDEFRLLWDKLDKLIQS